MQYPVIIESNNGVFRALIPAFPAISAEGVSQEEAVANAQHAVETYLAQVEVATIEINLPHSLSPRPGSPEAWLKAVEAFAGQEEIIREHFAEIAAERQRELEEMDQLEAA